MPEEKPKSWFLNSLLPGLLVVAVTAGATGYFQLRDENIIQRYEIDMLKNNMREFKCTIDKTADAFSAVARNLAVLNEKVSTLSENLNGKTFPKSHKAVGNDDQNQ